MHVELDLTGSKVRYEAGDHLAVCAANPPELVERLGAMLLPGLYNTPVEAESAAAAAAPDSSSGAGAGAKPNVPRVAWPVTLDAVLALENVEEMSSKRHPFPCPATFRTALTFYVDLSAPPRASLLSDLAEFAADPEHRARLKLLASHEGSLSLTHTHTLSLSLSHAHTHTHLLLLVLVPVFPAYMNEYIEYLVFWCFFRRLPLLKI